MIQSESAEYFHLGNAEPSNLARAQWENELRFLSLDLLFSHRPAPDLVTYLFRNEQEEFGNSPALLTDVPPFEYAGR